MARAGILTIVILTLISFAQVFPQNKQEFVPLRGVSSLAPSGAADFVLGRGVPPRIFSDYEYSSYLHWRFNGADERGVVPDTGLRPLFIDLFNAYPDKAMDDYFDILQAKPAGLRHLDLYGINTIILGRPHWETIKDETGNVTKKGDAITGYLEKSPAWKRVFSDNAARIWVRRTPLEPTVLQVVE